MTLEVLFLLDNGYATPEDIDKVAKAGFGLRLPILGLVQRMDFAGLDTMRKILANKAYQPPAVTGRSLALDDQVERGHLGVKSGKGFYDYQGRPTEEILKERDIKLLKLKSFLESVR